MRSQMELSFTVPDPRFPATDSMDTDFCEEVFEYQQFSSCRRIANRVDSDCWSNKAMVDSLRTNQADLQNENSCKNDIFVVKRMLDQCRIFQLP
ncbi:unnamed protein product [Soboliphyme baturini]|uniref:DUF19 domain-containing protein n=1 Tax=Soboliphyme baturini TaxID=241478 RepID=A0A183J2A6_9BILA|nr:unnamed protein product [Soboliphyme baturini]